MKNITFFLFGLLFLFFKVVSIQASFIKYPNNPVFDYGSSTSWDSLSVSAPYVLFDNGSYKMWYYGTQIKDQGSIGLATSSDGVNWTRYQHDAIFTKDVDEVEISSPKLLKIGSEYKMWYLSTKTSTTGNEFYRIKYASSNNGYDSWTKSGVVFSRSTATWEAEGVIPGTIMYENGIYRLWYGARDSSGFWRIGYAYSNDGKTSWIRETNPVLEETLSEEGNNVNAPSVYYDGQIYHMYYHAGTTPFYIGHATSLDGIHNWIKDQNHALNKSSVSSDFDSYMIGSPNILERNGTLLMFYGGNDGINISRGRIGLATDGIFPIPSPTPTPTPSPTPTPTPTPSPSPITSKIIIVPGLAGSWNTDALMNCNPNSTDTWTSWSLSDQIYQPFISVANQVNYTPLIFYYDWRKDPRNTAHELNTFISDNRTDNEKVYLLGHSLGGLVNRALLEQITDYSFIDRYVSVGTPHQGTPYAYPAWSAGDIWGNWEWKIAATILKINCMRVNKTFNDREVIRANIPSVQILLPVFPYLKYKQEALFLPFYNTNPWLKPENFPAPFNGIPIGTLSGNTLETLQSISVKNRSAHDVNLGNWQDGKPNGKIYSYEGDGTVLKSSSEIENADNHNIAKDHNGIMYSAEGINEIFNLLGINLGAPLDITNPTQPKTMLVLATNNADLIIKDNNGIHNSDKNGLYLEKDPETEIKQIVIKPKKSNSVLLVIQLLANDKTLWKEYKFNDINPEVRTLKFNAEDPDEDILQ